MCEHLRQEGRQQLIYRINDHYPDLICTYMMCSDCGEETDGFRAPEKYNLEPKGIASDG